ncbi:MAG: hypothetical protein CMI08_10535 [Oceanospirillaceae bacterium]|uniref:DUF1315 family protein n=1 Tax=unclassified Thalassolituus TaxID=2624967 RepID=UPI000C67D244|nr:MULTISPECIES: DUF1315 family protein [unclassified Thalassolituus]MAS24378.1 hypothetical protein [Oceanospirillaceae bacterium]MAX99619.1 hypothetical protein [Oceanospirillaceae bacterium]MBL35190.1 hypothetical protein [Oceanospirillaceae bacterium]MBS51320.1 hypothetical protein [Oceanospirillaceae bacterium]|tara:strand:- start:282 stop:542 length:261 start_codon:yes stop_codon:yes gene_type:complete
MTLDDLIQSLTPEMYQNLRTAVELGRFPDGRRLDKEQVEMCLQAIIYYEKVNDLPADQRVGYMEDSCKSSSHDHDDDDDVQTLTLQ